MLKRIDPRLNAEALYAVARMGHGDVIVLADANYPAASTAGSTAFGKVIDMTGLTLDETADAVLSVMPLDDLGTHAACAMQVDGMPETLPDVQQEAASVIALHEPGARLTPVPRMEFYERSRAAYALILTGERRFYGSLLLRKGVVAP